MISTNLGIFTEYLDFSFYYYQSFSRISRRKWEIVKDPIYHKDCNNWITCWDQVSILENQVNFATKIGCPFWTYLTLPLNSKIGPEWNSNVLFCVSHKVLYHNNSKARFHHKLNLNPVGFYRGQNNVWSTGMIGQILPFICPEFSVITKWPVIFS